MAPEVLVSIGWGYRALGNAEAVKVASVFAEGRTTAPLLRIPARRPTVPDSVPGVVTPGDDRCICQQHLSGARF